MSRKSRRISMKSNDENEVEMRESSPKRIKASGNIRKLTKIDKNDLFSFLPTPVLVYIFSKFLSLEEKLKS